MSTDTPKEPSKIILAPPPKACNMCGIELQIGSKHLSSAHCVRDLVQRVHFLRQITAAQAKQLDEMGTAVMANARFAYAILHHLTEGGNRVVLDRADFETLPAGACCTMTETPDGDFEILGVVPGKVGTNDLAPKEEAKPS